MASSIPFKGQVCKVAKSLGSLTKKPAKARVVICFRMKSDNDRGYHRQLKISTINIKIWKEKDVLMAYIGLLKSKQLNFGWRILGILHSSAIYHFQP